MLDIILSALLVAAVGLPAVNAFDKAKKEMEAEQADDNGCA